MKRKTIRNHRDFITSPLSPKTVTDFCVIKAKPAEIPGDARYGLIVSKRSFRLAVERNRAKRLIRDWISYNEDLMLPALDYIFILRNSILNSTRDQGRTAVSVALHKIAKAYNKNAKNEK